ncbi:uncharacterized protein FOBCDRAFT_227717 [Fusarium oxysporum Fo47]|uniref:Uncharacterized protein n=1 Tax=Fusarium oxysporum Fo47 TaxID=660027 RepID=W9J9A2_FUSOX|nr:uncharacterized protein FOBCDRAFT_227717 [Fusarium oxysporum Fo47]EWZ28632.1 hypothetical protein FOZG_17637 [Fusarium oxysporum Fo47]QKD57160.1 hypothetical protein FOBCDRAFT_227717 [Fusarium oxysporum Fo47]
MQLLIFVVVAALSRPCRGRESAFDVAGRLPSCAASCLYRVVSNSTSAITDIQYICFSHAVQEEASKCIESSCTFSDALFTKNATETACNALVRDRSNRYNATIIPLGVIALGITISRLLFKQFASRAQALSSDDWAIMGTLGVSVSSLVISVEGLTTYGLGKDIWTLTTAEIAKFALYFYIMSILYTLAMSLIKLSLSLFYQTIFFGNISPYILWGTITVNLLYGIAFVLAAIFQCSPVDYYWKQYLDGSKGQCVDINALVWLNAAVGVAVDLWMIAVPLSQVIHLRLHWKQKIGVVIMFLLGTFVTVVSVIRLQTLVLFAKSSNPTWDYWNVAVWSVIEIHVGMICTCLPTLRLILVRLFTRTFGSVDSVEYKHQTGNQDANTHWSKAARGSELAQRTTR